MEGPSATRYLLCITGLSPQVVTETVYALAREGGDALPTEVHVLSTAEGVERARLTLLSEDPGWFRRLCRDYGLPPIRFDDDCLHVLADATGAPMQDIRNAADNIAAADGVTEWVRRLTEAADAPLHVSLAGGRKTLGFFAGYALSLFGREQDRLSHVLVQSPFESHPGFFYPTPESHIIHGPPPDKKPLDTRNAAVTLADIPFLRLRHGLPEALLKGRGSYSETIRAAQRNLGPPHLAFDLKARRVTAGGVVVPLQPAELAFHAWLARRRKQGLEPVPCPSPSHQDYPNRSHADAFLAEYGQIAGALDGGGRVVQGLEYGMMKNYFERRKSRVNRILRETLGAGAVAYTVQAFGGRPHTRFGLRLEPESIQFF